MRKFAELGRFWDAFPSIESLLPFIGSPDELVCKEAVEILKKLLQNRQRTDEGTLLVTFEFLFVAALQNDFQIQMKMVTEMDVIRSRVADKSALGNIVLARCPFENEYSQRFAAVFAGVDVGSVLSDVVQEFYRFYQAR
jgi:hypothetical protein